MALSESLDHEVVFLFAVTLGVLGLSALITWFGKATGHHGISSLAQHP